MHDSGISAHAIHRFIFVLMILQTQLLASPHIDYLSYVPIRLCKPNLIAPWLFMTFRLKQHNAYSITHALA